MNNLLYETCVVNALEPMCHLHNERLKIKVQCTTVAHLNQVSLMQRVNIEHDRSKHEDPSC